MAILDQISEKSRDYLRYQARQKFLREQRTMERLMEEERQAREQERLAKEQAQRAEQAARVENEALRAKLRALGIDPDAP